MQKYAHANLKFGNTALKNEFISQSATFDNK
jgi:hypothetical protein